MVFIPKYASWGMDVLFYCPVKIVRKITAYPDSCEADIVTSLGYGSCSEVISHIQFKRDEANYLQRLSEEQL